MVTVSIEREVVSKPFFTKAWLGRQSMAWSTHVGQGWVPRIGSRFVGMNMFAGKKNVTAPRFLRTRE